MAVYPQNLQKTLTKISHYMVCSAHYTVVVLESLYTHKAAHNSPLYLNVMAVSGVSLPAMGGKGTDSFGSVGSAGWPTSMSVMEYW